MEYLGDWKNDLDNLSKSFLNNSPYPHVVINNFFEERIAECLSDKFPNSDSSSWKIYNNPLEHKYSHNEINLMPQEFQKIFEALQNSIFIDLIKKITDIPNLENDPLLHGAGLHFYPKRGKLDLHLDYSLHPFLNKERRVNLIIYLNKNFKEEWGGHLELRSKDLKTCAKVFPHFNSAVLFQTSDYSVHGVPEEINCPPEQGRMSIAIYYISHPREDMIVRKKAEFLEVPGEINIEKKNTLREIRKNRLITEKDLAEILPEWNKY